MKKQSSKHSSKTPVLQSLFNKVGKLGIKKNFPEQVFPIKFMNFLEICVSSCYWTWLHVQRKLCIWKIYFAQQVNQLLLYMNTHFPATLHGVPWCFLNLWTLLYIYICQIKHCRPLSGNSLLKSQNKLKIKLRKQLPGCVLQEGCP